MPPGVCSERHATLGDDRVVRAEDEVADRRQEGGVAVDGLVDLGVLSGEEPRLRLVHRREDRRRARLVDVDTLGERDLAGARVGAEALHEPEDRVRRAGLEVSEHGHPRMVAGLSCGA